VRRNCSESDDVGGTDCSKWKRPPGCLDGTRYLWDLPVPDDPGDGAFAGRKFLALFHRTMPRPHHGDEADRRRLWRWSSQPRRTASTSVA